MAAKARAEAALGAAREEPVDQEGIDERVLEVARRQWHARGSMA